MRRDVRLNFSPLKKASKRWGAIREVFCVESDEGVLVKFSEIGRTAGGERMVCGHDSCHVGDPDGAGVVASFERRARGPEERQIDFA